MDVILCKHGHKLTPDNIYVRPNGAQRCKICRSLDKERFRASASKAGPWTASRLKELHRLVDEGKTPRQIALELGLVLSCVQGRISREKMTAEKREAQAKQKKEWVDRNIKGANPSKPRIYRPAAEVTASRPSEALVAEARRRALAPRSLSAMLLGDPPVGFSMLDRKLAASSTI